MADLNSIGNTNDHPADGHGYVPVRGKKDSDTAGNETQNTTPESKEDSQPEMDVARKLRDLSYALNALQERLISSPDDDVEGKEKIKKTIKENQVAMENLCSLGDATSDPAMDLECVTNILKEGGINPSVSAVTRLLGDS